MATHPEAPAVYHHWDKQNFTLQHHRLSEPHFTEGETGPETEGVRLLQGHPASRRQNGNSTGVPGSPVLSPSALMEQNTTWVRLQPSWPQWGHDTVIFKVTEQEGEGRRLF